MEDTTAYWSQLINLVHQFGCWVRVPWRDGDTTEKGRWGKLLIMPVEGYLEGPDGPWPLRIVEAVEVSTIQVVRRVGVAPQMIDLKDEILAGLQGTDLKWELRETKWSMEGSGRLGIAGFEDEPVLIVRFANPYGPAPAL